MAIRVQRSLIMWVGIAAVWLIAGWLFLQAKPVGPKHLTQTATDTPRPSVSTAANRPISKAQLAAANGQNGAACWVSVRGAVYNVPDSSVWQGGSHVPSNGLVYCGIVGDDTIGRSPHGDTVLASLEVVGQLQ